MDTPNFGGTILVFMECKISKNNAGSVTNLQNFAFLSQKGDFNHIFGEGRWKKWLAER